MVTHVDGVRIEFSERSINQWFAFVDTVSALDDAEPP